MSVGHVLRITAGILLSCLHGRRPRPVAVMQAAVGLGCLGFLISAGLALAGEHPEASATRST